MPMTDLICNTRRTDMPAHACLPQGRVARRGERQEPVAPRGDRSRGYVAPALGIPPRGHLPAAAPIYVLYKQPQTPASHPPPTRPLRSGQRDLPLKRQNTRRRGARTPKPTRAGLGGAAFRAWSIFAQEQPRNSPRNSPKNSQTWAVPADPPNQEQPRNSQSPSL